MKTLRGRVRRVCMGYPLLMPALCAMAAVGVAEGMWLLGWLCLFIAGLIGSFFSRRWVLPLSLTCAVMAWGLHFTELRGQEGAAAQSGKMWSGEAVVLECSDHGRALLLVTGGELEGQKLSAMLPYGHGGYLPGEMVGMTGRLMRPPVGRNPGEFDQRAWLHRQGVELNVEDGQWRELGEWDRHYTIKRWAVLARNYVRSALGRGLDEAGEPRKVILAMFLGDRPVDARELVDDFSYSGTIHVFAVSGLHVMMIGGLVGFLLKLCNVRQWVWIPVCVLMMFFYALITGLNPPALRAAIMGTIFLGGYLVGRKATLGNSLAAGGLIAFLLDGHVLYSPGFQLSFAVLAAIALLNSWCGSFLSWVSYVDPFLPRSLYSGIQEWSFNQRRKLRDSLTVSCSAWFGATPLMLWHFGVVTPISIIAGLPLVLLVFCVLSLSCLSLVVGVVSARAGEWVNGVTACCASLSHACADLFAEVPGGHFVLRPWSSGERVVVFTVSEGGGCSYLGIGGGVLIDAAGARSFKREVGPCLLRQGAAVDSVILSHADAGHCGGVSELLKMYSVKQALLPEHDAQSSRYKDVLKSLREMQIQSSVAVAGQWLELAEGARIEVLWSPHGRLRGSWADDRCMVLRLHWRGYRILFMNDAGYQVEQWLESEGVDLSADVLVAGKHNKDVSLSQGFLQKVKPKAMVLTSTLFPAGEWRSNEWRDQLAEKGVKVFSQDVCGAVEMVLAEDGALLLRGHLGGEMRITWR